MIPCRKHHSWLDPPWRGGGQFNFRMSKAWIYSFRRTYPPWFLISFLYSPRFWVIFSELMAFPLPPFANLKKLFLPWHLKIAFRMHSQHPKKNVNFFLYSAIVVFFVFLDWKKEAEMKLRAGGRQNCPFCRVSAKISTPTPPHNFLFLDGAEKTEMKLRGGR